MEAPTMIEASKSTSTVTGDLTASMEASGKDPL